MTTRLVVQVTHSLIPMGQPRTDPYSSQPTAIPSRYKCLRVPVPEDTFDHKPILGPVELDDYLRNPGVQRRFAEERRRANDECFLSIWARATYTTQV